MAKMEGRVRYDENDDSFVYEIRPRGGEWGMCSKARCVRRENAKDGEEANFIPYSFMQRIVHDVDMHGMRVHLA